MILIFIHVISILVPDVHLIPKSRHEIYFISSRDPLERIMSAFVYSHPKNRRARGARRNGISREENVKAFKCFPTLEEFAQLLGKQDGNCSAQAKRAVDGETKIMVNLWGNYQKMVSPVLTTGSLIYVFRNDHLWEDWRDVNNMLDPNRTVVIPTGKKSNMRDTSSVNLPVTRELSGASRSYLCQAIQQEYRVYFSLLSSAMNLNETDVQEAREKAYRNCPNLILQELQ